MRYNFKSRDEALDALAFLKKEIAVYGKVSVMGLCDWLDFPSEKSDALYGWADISAATVTDTDYAVYLDLPFPEPILPVEPREKSSSWRRGYSEARDLIQKSEGQDADYEHGYEAGVREKVRDRAISLNTARRLLGMADRIVIFSHPTHYTDGRIEVWDFIADKNLNFLLGNVVKYVCRAGKKDQRAHLQDLEKARVYLNREIERIKEDEMDRTGLAE